MRIAAVATRGSARPPGAGAATARAFTLIELLVVIAIIALLVTILMPSLSAAKRLARTMLCASLIRGYSLATDMYAENNQGYMMDSLYHLSPTVGIPKYWGNSSNLPSDIGRCPDDEKTESLGRLGHFTQYGDDVWVSIGCNENMLSCSSRATSAGYKAFWIHRDKLSGLPSRLMTWTDWQNNPVTDPPSYAVVKPAVGAMGSLVFRHQGEISNAAFLDGHVGKMKATIATTNQGHDLADGATWNITGSVLQLYKVYYPFGVGATQTAGDSSNRGDFPDIKLN